MDIGFDRRGALAVVTLDRPQALNALTLEMAEQLDHRLVVWASDPTVAAVVIRSAGGRAFCAGGDIRTLFEAGKRGDAYVANFYRTEYRLNHRIATYAKPYIAVIDGIVMGGGVGVSIHGSHRIVTERCQFAMPETGIGFFPDVGGSWFLPRCPGALGMYLGLTGARIGAADMLYCGLATHHLPSGDLGSATADLECAAWSGDPGVIVAGVLARYRTNPGAPPLAEHRTAIDRCFAADSVDGMLSRLDADGSTWARDTAAVLRCKSPTSLKVALGQLRRGAELEDFGAAMRMEYRLSQRFMAAPDFYEGVRAAVIDKDQMPRWQPASLADVSDEAVARFFEPLDGPELDLSGG